MKMERVINTEILRYAPDVLFITEADGRIIFANDNALKVLGYTQEELRAMTVLDISPIDWRLTYKASLEQVVADTQRHIFEIRLISKSGVKIPMELHVVRLPSGILYGSCRDITERKQNAVKLAEAYRHLTNLIETIPDPIFFKDGEGRWLIINQPAKQLFCLESIDWHGKTDMELAEIQPAFRSAYEGCVRDDRLAWEKGSLLVTEENVTSVNGEQLTLEVLKLPTYRADGTRRGLVIIGRDITEHKRAQQRIHELAFYDPVTLLPNRRLLLDRLGQSCAASTHKKSYGAVLLVDMDHFKEHSGAVGDELLRDIAQRLVDLAQDGDTVACLGADAFVVIMNGLSTTLSEAADASMAFAEIISAGLKSPFLIQEKKIRTTASIGISLFRSQEEIPEILLKQAQGAMERSKAAGRDIISFYDADIQSGLQVRSQLEKDLRIAIEQQQFVLYYQAQVNESHHIVGAEVLLRWQHPERGLVPPMGFIGLCEEIGLIVPIGLWVMEQACKQLRLWERNESRKDLVLAVNVSAKQFHQGDFVPQVKRILNETQARGSHLKLELTESSMLANIDDTVYKMRELQALGIRFSMDDFGTGHSSLNYLKRLPLDQIKIDQSFVREVTTNAHDATIVKTIISMSKALGLHIIAEGVEELAQRDFLSLHGCRDFQGYRFGRPIPLPEFEVSLQKSPIKATN